MIFKITFKPIKTVGDFFVIYMFFFPLYIVVNVLVVAIPLLIAWNGVHMYWEAVKPIDFWLAVRFAFGINLFISIMGCFRKSD
jgi:hypothetical protein